MQQLFLGSEGNGRSDRFPLALSQSFPSCSIVAFQSVAFPSLDSRLSNEFSEWSLKSEMNIFTGKTRERVIGLNLVWMVAGISFRFASVWRLDVCRSNVASNPHKKVSLTGRIRNVAHGTVEERGFFVTVTVCRSPPAWPGLAIVTARYISGYRTPISSDRQSLPAARAFRSLFLPALLRCRPLPERYPQPTADGLDRFLENANGIFEISFSSCSIQGTGFCSTTIFPHSSYCALPFWLFLTCVFAAKTHTHTHTLISIGFCCFFHCSQQILAEFRCACVRSECVCVKNFAWLNKS